MPLTPVNKMSHQDATYTESEGNNSFRLNARGFSTYSHHILNPEEIQLHKDSNHGYESILAHARAKRLMSVPDKRKLKHLLNHHLILLDHPHYVRVEREDWMPMEWYFLGERLGHEPTEDEKADFILQKRSPSELYRYYYYFRFREMVRIGSQAHVPDSKTDK